MSWFRSAVLAALACSFVACRSSPVPSPEQTAVTPADTEPVPLGGDEWAAWISARLAVAGTEIVELPLVRHMPGFGCDCPDFYVGDSTVVGGGTFIEPVGDVVMPPAGDEGWIKLARGWFVGVRSRYDSRDPADYFMEHFHVVALEPLTPETEGQARVVGRR